MAVRTRVTGNRPCETQRPDNPAHDSEHRQLQIPARPPGPCACRLTSASYGSRSYCRCVSSRSRIFAACRVVCSKVGCAPPKLCSRYSRQFCPCSYQPSFFGRRTCLLPTEIRCASQTYPASSPSARNRCWTALFALTRYHRWLSTPKDSLLVERRRMCPAIRSIIASRMPGELLSGNHFGLNPWSFSTLTPFCVNPWELL